MDKYQLRGLKSAFNTQLNDAKRRGIAFEFSFEEWLKVWTESGHLHERGNRKNQYVMARNGDTGPYAEWNVRCVTVAKNVNERHLGATRSKETCQNISRAKKGKTFFSPEHRAKISQALKGRTFTPIWRKNLSRAMIGNSNGVRKKST